MVWSGLPTCIWPGTIEPLALEKDQRHYRCFLKVLAVIHTTTPSSEAQGSSTSSGWTLMGRVR